MTDMTPEQIAEIEGLVEQLNDAAALPNGLYAQAATALETLILAAKERDRLKAENERTDDHDAPDDFSRRDETIRLLREAGRMALAAIDDHNKRSPYRSLTIEEFHMKVPIGSKITCLSDARAALEGTTHD